MLRVLLCLMTLLLAGVPAAAQTKSDELLPNFIIILCDDLGYADIEPFGSELHRTPNLSEMAREGVCLTSFYVTSGVCSPSRSSLMTGCYPRRVGLHQNEKGQWVLFPGNQRGLNPDEVTIAEVLKEKGYATACVGKWHLGDQTIFLPTRQGFDSYFGIPYSNDMGHTDRPKKTYPPLPLLRNEEVIEQEPDQRYLTKRYTEEALKFIKANRDQPFFLYMPHTMPHWPQYSSEAFAGKSKNGKWGDTVEEIDWSVGQIFKTLKDLEIDERTMVVFLSDNGGAVRHGAKNTPLRGGKGSTWEGGQRVPFVARWPGKIPEGMKSNVLATSMDLLPTIAELAGVEPKTNGPIDGKSMRALLMGETEETQYEVFYYYHRGTLEAVRSGPWKLFVDKQNKNQFEPALFNLNDDISEQFNLLQRHPAVVDRLTRLAEAGRVELGHRDKPGSGSREPGHVKDARPLTQNESD